VASLASAFGLRGGHRDPTDATSCCLLENVRTQCLNWSCQQDLHLAYGVRPSPWYNPKPDSDIPAPHSFHLETLTNDRGTTIHSNVRPQSACNSEKLSQNGTPFIGNEINNYYSYHERRQHSGRPLASGISRNGVRSSKGIIDGYNSVLMYITRCAATGNNR